MKYLSGRKIKGLVRKMNQDWNNYRSGVEAKFFNLGEFGVKIYEDRDSGESALRHQTLAAYFGLGPKVYRRINIAGMGFGFITEIADTSISESWDCQSDEYYELESALQEIGIYHDDLHRYNVGVIDGEYVCIDFGPISAGE